MTDREPMQLTPEEERLRQEIRAFAEISADPDFKSRLEQAFVSGAFADPTAQAKQWEREQAPRPAGGPRWRWALVPALGILIGVLVVLSQGPPWSLRTVTGAGEILVNGRAVSALERDELARTIGPEAHLQVPEGVEIQIVCRGVLLVEIMPGTEMTVPHAPRRWFKGTLRSWVHKGEILVKSGPNFPGQELLIQTAEGKIFLSGTTISVYKGDDFTCVCVLTGEARIGRDEENLDLIPGGMRKVMFGDGRPPLITEIASEHEQGLLQFEKMSKEVFQE